MHHDIVSYFWGDIIDAQKLINGFPTHKGVDIHSTFGMDPAVRKTLILILFHTRQT